MKTTWKYLEGSGIETKHAFRDLQTKAICNSNPYMPVWGDDPKELERRRPCRKCIYRLDDILKSETSG